MPGQLDGKRDLIIATNGFEQSELPVAVLDNTNPSRGNFGKQ